ncbi:carbohydrate ABC transporter permease [Alicyclobacillus acidocaldarius]|uniref:Binding-protein-dependent transport systems inner membrane component n=2 Tax=Alicyclobacillus TaxID=29330 RepID=C8WSH9_ALIAD|nr:carbohydrate ABC transporter permease [Alicyclobacillus acidocaldarius]ACV59464.1 binding-protein-dependent transport systems inner membrane component [Alicyclobacillus acidocaldarius subsp. acidocaldarius DSM 446]
MTGTIRTRRGIVLAHAVLVIIGFFLIYPVLWMVFGSFKPTNEIFSSASFWPKHWTFANYPQGWNAIPGLPFGTFILHSLSVSCLVSVGTVISSAIVAFGFARFTFRGKSILFGIMMITMMLPTQVTLIPQYAMFHDLGWINTYYPLIVPAFFGSPFFIFLIVQFIRGLPKELDEAAKIDGCNAFTLFVRVILPLIVPALITTAIFSFIWCWDDFFSQLIYLNSAQKFTVPLGLESLANAVAQEEWGPLFAMSTVSLIPLFLIFFFLQKYVVRGIATTGLRG